MSYCGGVLPLEIEDFGLLNRKKNEAWLYCILDGYLSSELQTTKSRLFFILKVGFSGKNFILDQRKYFMLTEYA